MRVLVIEDEVRLAENIASALREGPRYAVDVVHDGEDGLLYGLRRDYDGIVLDLMLPERSGAEVLKRIRQSSVKTPVLVLTAISDTARIIELLDLGADDYLSKPFDLGELIARLRAIVRRGKGVAETVLRFGSITLHVAEHRVDVKESTVEFSPTEHRILEYFLHRPKVVVSPQELLEHLFDFTWASHSNVVEVHVSNIRKKLRAAGSLTTLENIRGRGYRLSEHR